MTTKEELEWHPFYFNGIETNIEVTRCGNIRRLKKEWFGFKNAKLGEINFEKLALNNGYKFIGIHIKGGKKTSLFLHQILAITFLGHKPNGINLVIDHIDSDKLNNHIDNLRIITNRDNTSKERTIKKGLPVGVHWIKFRKKYESKIRIKGKSIFLGYFNTMQEASDAYKNKLKEHLFDDLYAS